MFVHSDTGLLPLAGCDDRLRTNQRYEMAVKFVGSEEISFATLFCYVMCQ